VPLERDLVPLECDLVPLERGLVPLERDLVPLEHDLVPLEHDLVPLERDLVPLERDKESHNRDKERRNRNLFRRNRVYERPRAAGFRRKRLELSALAGKRQKRRLWPPHSRRGPSRNAGDWSTGHDRVIRDGIFDNRRALQHGVALPQSTKTRQQMREFGLPSRTGL